MLNINDKIPDFEILTDRGSFTPSNHLGKNIVIFFFPRADTSGCTAES
jgi:peroxiredoxin Q/BCP